MSQTSQSSPLRGIENGHEWVDLGLPSGLKWATCNIGASSPEEVGDFFAWGETEPRSKFTSDNYKFGTWDADRAFTGTKYIADAKFGNVDGKLSLDPEDDAAIVQWGGKWRMPTAEEIDELREFCVWELVGDYYNNEDVLSRLKSRINGNVLILPFAGALSERGGCEKDLSGNFWSSNLHPEYQGYARYLLVESRHRSTNMCCRYCGLSIRPVFK